ncbi:M48 family metalloprotease [Parerythrobacter lacustris]|uniref:M48 family metalloprotease n=1 Tax=Parerythrobacter lacustris TaxID=2969984 RepID=A0ABT1XS62_9SPHN|nr:M48 family metalloprotease [Parerythrobacter lacustris]MCR2834067.1 M48 family metalloprotease [Parerythrobacter lacustris]
MAKGKSRILGGVALATLALTGCAAGSIPGASTPITQSEAQQGAEYHPQLLAEFGGTYQGSQAAYIESVGKNIAVQSGLGNAREDFTVSVLNSPVNNAFAIPGGYIYTTRQLVALMNNEAELAGVLGHEVGHVAARHSQRRQSAAQQNTLIGAGLAILTGVLLGDSQVGNTLSRGFLQGSQLLTLRFSRTQELEADELGIQYLTGAGYDPRAMSTVLQSLASQNALDAQLQGAGNASIPEWASTHPDPQSRVQTALTKAGAGTGTLNRDVFLTRIDGILYGDDPAQGVIEGQQFIHPDLRLSFSVPQGFYMVNSPRAVSINGQSGKAQFSTGPYSGNLETYLRSVFTALGGQQQALAPSSIQRTTVNGIPAAYGTARVNNGSSQVDVTVFAYEFGNSQAFHFATIVPAGQSGTFNAMFNSVRRISTSEAAAIKPRYIDVVTVARGDTVQSLANRMAYDSGKVERFRVLNALGPNDTLQAGQKVKLVVRSR